MTVRARLLCRPQTADMSFNFGAVGCTRGLPSRKYPAPTRFWLVTRWSWHRVLPARRRTRSRSGTAAGAVRGPQSPGAGRIRWMGDRETSRDRGRWSGASSMRLPSRSPLQVTRSTSITSVVLRGCPAPVDPTGMRRLLRGGRRATRREGHPCRRLFCDSTRSVASSTKDERERIPRARRQ